jgi:hypothetical protein
MIRDPHRSLEGGARIAELSMRGFGKASARRADATSVGIPTSLEPLLTRVAEMSEPFAAQAREALERGRSQLNQLPRLVAADPSVQYWPRCPGDVVALQHELRIDRPTARGLHVHPLKAAGWQSFWQSDPVRIWHGCQR